MSKLKLETSSSLAFFSEFLGSDNTRQIRTQKSEDSQYITPSRIVSRRGNKISLDS